MHIFLVPLGVFFVYGSTGALPTLVTEPVREVWVFEDLAYEGADLPFVRSGPEYIPERGIPPPAMLRRIAAEERVVFEICSPRSERTLRTRAERRRDCAAYGVSVETRRQP